MTLDFILRIVLHYFNVRYVAIIGKCNNADLVRARHTYAYIAKFLTDKSYKEISDLIFRNHSLIVYSVIKLNKSNKLL